MPYTTLSQKFLKSSNQLKFQEDFAYNNLIKKINKYLNMERINIEITSRELWIIKQSLILKEILKTKKEDFQTFKKFMNTEGISWKLNALWKEKELRKYLEEIYLF